MREEIVIQKFILVSGFTRAEAHYMREITGFEWSEMIQCFTFIGRLPDSFELQFIEICGLNLFLNMSLIGIVLSHRKPTLKEG